MNLLKTPRSRIQSVILGLLAVLACFLVGTRVKARQLVTQPNAPCPHLPPRLRNRNPLANLWRLHPPLNRQRRRRLVKH